MSSPVKDFALAHGLAVDQPKTLRDAVAIRPLLECGADLLVVVAYGLILPPAALRAARLGAINIHASLLPRWRGAAPIQRALMAGDTETGICIMQMDEGLDTGPILTRHRVAIQADDDTGSLHDRLALVGARAVVDAVDLITRGKIQPQAQSNDGAIYAHKITRQDQELDWRRSNVELERCVRALRPVPGARAFRNGEMVKVWAGSCVNGDAEPGTVLDASAQGIVVACGEGALRVTSLQRAGGTRVGADEFLRGHVLARGDRFDLPSR